MALHEITELTISKDGQTYKFVSPIGNDDVDANFIFAGPASGSPELPYFRKLTISDLPDDIPSLIKVHIPSIDHLPQTYSAIGLTEDLDLVSCLFSNPVAQKSDWNITISNDTINIVGDVTDSLETDVTLYLVKSKSISVTS